MSTELDDFLRRKQLEGQGAARTLVEASGAVSPEEAARRVKYKREYGVDAPGSPQAEPLETSPDIQEALAAVQRDPTVAKWLRKDQNHAALAKGAYTNLADTSEAIGEAGAPKERSWLESAKSLLLSGSTLVSPLGALTRAVGAVQTGRAAAADLTPGNLGRALGAGSADAAAGFAGTVEAGAELFQKFSPSAAASRELFGTDGMDTVAGFARQRRQGWEKLAEQTAPEATTEEGEGVLSGVRSMPLSIAALVSGAFSGGATTAGILMGAAVGGQSYGRARDYGLSVEQSALYGTIDAGIETVTERLTFLKALDVGTPFLKRFGQTLLTENVGEQFATLGQDFNAWANIESSQGKTFEDFLRERPDAAYQTALAATTMTGALSTTVSALEYGANKVGRTLARTAYTEDTKRFASALGGLVKANSVLARDRGSFEDFVRDAAEGTDATDVFVEAEQLQTILNQSELTVEEAFDMTGLTPEQLQDAVDRGEDISIPIEQYAARVAPTAIGDGLLDHLRLDPDHMSPAQAKTYLQGVKEELASAAEQGAVQSEQQSLRQASRAAVEGKILGNLETARRFTPDVNEAYASLVGAFYDTQSAKLGLTAEEMFTRYPLQVQSGEVAQPTYDQPQGALVNVGLDIPAGGRLDPQQVRDALAAIGVNVNAENIAQSDTEQTFIGQLDRALTPEEAYALSEQLGQEAVAQFAGGQGALIGPQAEKWGDFNPEFFLGMDGSRMRETADVTDPAFVKELADEADKALSGDAAKAIDTFVGMGPGAIDAGVWGGLMNARELEGAFEPGADPAVREALEEAFAPVREQLRAKFGDRIRLYRRQGAVETEAGVEYMSRGSDGTRRVLSWTSDRKVAEWFAGLMGKDAVEYTEEEIVAAEATFAETGTVKLQRGYELRSSQIEVPVPGSGPPGVFPYNYPEQFEWTTAESIDIYHRGESITDTDSVRAFMERHNEEARETNADRDAKRADVIEASVPLDRVVWVTDRAGQMEFIVRNEEEARPFVDQTGALFNQSAAPLQALPMGVQGTGPGGRILNRDLGEAFTLRHMAKYGRALDPSNADDYSIALEALVEDYENQAAQPDNGEAWYSDDIAEAIQITTQIMPELADPVNRDLFLTVAALLSPQQAPTANWENAVYAMQGYLQTGKLALRKPSGKQFGVGSHTTGLQLMQHLIDTHGVEGALLWVRSPQTGKAMAEARRDSGLFAEKPRLGMYTPSELNLNDVKLGVYMFGPKVGDFAQNSTGLDDQAITIDLWAARTYNRIIGRLTDTADPTSLADTPRGRGERDVIKSLFRDAAERAGIAPSSMQAALWYFEQRLYRNHGIRSESTNFSGAARAAARKLGDGGTAQARPVGGAGTAAADLEEGVRVYDQSAQVDPLKEFYRESLYPTIAVRHADGTVYTDAKGLWPERLDKIAEKIGATAVVAVPANDNRLQAGVPLWHTRPPVNADGTITIQHWGPEGVTQTDPSLWGQSNSLPKSERAAIGSSLPRTYFGIASGQPGGYKIEFPGRNQYEARVPAERLYDVAADPDGLKQGDGVPALERRIAAAGYLGYWTKNEQLGLVATVFEPVPVQPAKANVMFQDAVFFSALERTLEKTATNKASAQQWKATLEKTPGIKAEELEWTGLFEFLDMQEGPITREQLIEVVRGAGLRVDEVVLGQERTYKDYYEAGWTIEGHPDTNFRVFDALGDIRMRDDGVMLFDTREEAEAFANDLSPLQTSALSPQFASWSSDPSNETYRELLITLPIGEGRNPNRAPSTHWGTDGVIAHARFMDKTDADGKRVLFIEEVQSDWHQKGRDQGYAATVDPKARAAAEAAYDTAQRYEDEVLTQLGDRMGVLWQERFESTEDANDRMDWAMRNPQPQGSWSYRQITTEAGTYRNDEEVNRLLAEVNSARLRTLEAGQASSNLMGAVGTPNAPFRTDWPALVMKRMIRYAAEHGYERIAWTTGEQQAERYNLSQSVGGINAMLGTDGRYRVSLFESRAQDILADNGLGERTDNGTLLMTEAQLKEAFGGDISQQLIEQTAARAADPEVVAAQQAADEAMRAYNDALATDLSGEGDPDASYLAVQETQRAANEAQRRVPDRGITLQGADNLRVGGEGMKAFYDRNLVNITNKLVKKYGAKVGPVAIQSREQEGRLQGARQMLRLIEAGIRDDEAIAATDPVAERRLQSEFVSDGGYAARDAQLAEIAEYEAGVPQPGFDITPELADVAMGGFPLFQKTGSPRGQIAFGNDITRDPSTITLLRGADLSTFVHELGHFFFEVTNHMASQAGAPQQIVADRDAMLRYLGVESASEWENRTPAQRREGHERMARSFEAFLFEGKTPSLELRSLFGRLRNWMVQVYRTITRLDVELTDEVRGAFTRMLASDEAIAEAEADGELAPLFQTKPEGMSDSDWEEYQQLNLDARTEAAVQLESRSLRDMRFAGRAVAKEIKRLQREVADQRAVVREEVEAELSAQPVYRAIAELRSKESDLKLNTGILRDFLRLDGAPLPDAFRGMTSDDGVHPSQVAEVYGFTSADHMVQDLLFAPSLRDAVEAETDQRMRERYGDLNTPEEVEQAARAAVHNEVRGRFVATELAALQNAPGKKRVLAAAAKRLAEDMIARLRIRDLRPGQYEAAERRAAKAAQAAGTGNIDELVRQKRNQLFQFNAAKAAHDARDEMRKAREYLTKFANKNTRSAIDVDYLDQIDQLLERYELRQISNKEADRRKNLYDWVEQMRAMGFEPALDAETLAEIGRKNWRDLTVTEMRGVLDAVRNIEYLGRITKKLLTAKNKADLDQAAGEMAEALRANAYKQVDEIVGAKSWWERVRGAGADFFAMHRKLANMVHVFDGGQYGGVFWEYFVRPMNEAGDREATMVAAAQKRLAELFKQVANEDTTKREFVPEIGRSLSLEDRLMVALNWGNSNNRQRILDGDKWTPAQVEAILAPLQAHHWDFVENVWTEIDSFWPEIAAKERRVSGIVPEKVEAEPFQVELGGELRLIRGGYFPIKYDPDRSSKAEADNAAEIQRQIMQGLHTRATTRRGHTKARVDQVNRPVQKSFSVIFAHVNQVVHDLAWHEYLIDANRLLRHGAVDAAIREHYGPETLRWIRKALEDIAIGDLGAQNAFEQAINHIRSGASVAAMGWNLWTSLLQPVGLTQSVARIGAKHVARGIGDLFSSPTKMNEKIEWVYSVSPFMRERGNTMQREIAEIRNRIAAKSPLRKAFDRAIPQGITSAVGDSYFYMIAKAQLIADLPTWLGQYDKSMDAGETPDRAAAIADQAVIDSQGAGQIKDLAGIQRGSPLMRLWTNFYSYFSATMNLAADRTTQLRRVGPSDLPYYAVDMLLLTVVPATITSLMYSLLRAGEDDPEEIVKSIAVDNFAYLAGLFVGVREIAATASGIAGYQGPAGARFFAEIGKLGKQVGQGEADEAALRAANSTAGILLHYPAGQLDRTVRGTIAAAKGEAGPQAVLVGPPPRQ